MEIVHNLKELGLDLNKKVYECSSCGKLFNWSEQSEWYGTLKDMDENPKKLKYSCSPVCKAELQKVFKDEPINELLNSRKSKKNG